MPGFQNLSGPDVIGFITFAVCLLNNFIIIMGLRILRSFLLLLAGVLAVALNRIMTGYAVVFGIILVVSAALTLIYVFLHFDENINQKVVLEMLADGFAGLVLFTYPNFEQHFLFIVFGFWIFIMGGLYLVAALMEEKTNPSCGNMRCRVS